ncbi:MAG: hypothetical protein HXY22_10585, partial [Alphaproteobacteria bacterium]|nr:hypothetical protein [Alphaproteobacteria bacterium]
MIRILWYFLVAVAVALIAAFMAEQTGDLVLTWGRTEIRMSLPVAAGIAGLGLAAVLLLHRVLTGVIDAPGTASRWLAA